MTEPDPAATPDPRPCNECGKPHKNIGPFDGNGKRLIDNWRDPNDGHAYYTPTWEQFARALLDDTEGQTDDVERVAFVLRELARSVIAHRVGGTVEAMARSALRYTDSLASLEGAEHD